MHSLEYPEDDMAMVTKKSNVKTVLKKTFKIGIVRGGQVVFPDGVTLKLRKIPDGAKVEF